MLNQTPHVSFCNRLADLVSDVTDYKANCRLSDKWDHHTAFSRIYLPDERIGLSVVNPSGFSTGADYPLAYNLTHDFIRRSASDLSGLVKCVGVRVSLNHSLFSGNRQYLIQLDHLMNFEGNGIKFEMTYACRVDTNGIIDNEIDCVIHCYGKTVVVDHKKSLTTYVHDIFKSRLNTATKELATKQANYDKLSAFVKANIP